jgi:hypothetical protein
MAKTNSSFYNIVPKLSRDPLGIIALFIALTYAIAALVLGFGSHLTAAQKWPLLGFLVGFPVIVLFSFLWLVINYNQKLYSPEDYRSDKSFLETLQPGKQIFDEDEKGSSDGNNASDGSKSLQTQSTTKKKPNAKKVRTAAVEDLALRDLEIQMDTPFWRQHGIRSKVDGDPILFNALAIKPEEIILVDIKVMDEEKNTSANFYSKFQQKVQSARNTKIKRSISSILVMLTENHSNKQIQTMKKNFDRMKQKDDSNLRVQWYDINDLLTKYKLQ